MHLVENRKASIWTLMLIYCISQWLLCAISGQWWDDWCIWLNDLAGLKSMFWEMGLPWETYNLLSVMWIPNWGYRVVVFLLFLTIGLLFYEILCRIDFFTNEDAFWIAAIAMTVPVNDARITLICYGYSLSFALFVIAFFLVTRLNDRTGYRKIIMRIISLVCLIYSYTMGSLLVFTGLIWLYLFYDIWRQSKGENVQMPYEVREGGKASGLLRKLLPALGYSSVLIGITL